MHSDNLYACLCFRFFFVKGKQIGNTFFSFYWSEWCGFFFLNILSLLKHRRICNSPVITNSVLVLKTTGGHVSLSSGHCTVHGTFFFPPLCYLRMVTICLGFFLPCFLLAIVPFCKHPSLDWSCLWRFLWLLVQ